MEVLPLKFIQDEDQIVFGQNITNLARLARLNFPIADILVVSTPEIPLRSVLRHFSYHNLDAYEQSLNLIKDQIFMLPLPTELLNELNSKDKKLNPSLIWLSLLNSWISELKLLITKNGVNEDLVKQLSPQTVIFSNQILAKGQAFMDYETKDSVINLVEGKLSPKHLQRLDQIIETMDKKLFLPQIYEFILDEKEGLNIIKVVPQTENLNINTQISSQTFLEQQIESKEQKLKKSLSLKIFLNPKNNLLIYQDLDGMLIEGENFEDFDKLILRLVEASISLGDKPLIFKLADYKDQFGGIRGTLKLLHQKQLFTQNVESFLFARNKKKLLNLQIAVPFIRSYREFLEIKKELSAAGVSRKGSLKLWMEVAIPENILNIKSYITAGLDGLILNLEELVCWLGGFDPNHPDSYPYRGESLGLISKDHQETLFTLLDPFIKETMRANIPILVTGEGILQDEILEYLIKKGVWGVVINSEKVDFLPDQIRFIEQRAIALA